MKLPAIYDNLTRQQRREVREEYVTRQSGRCMWCNEKLSDSVPEKMHSRYIDWSLFPGGKEGFLKYPVHLQHCHTTGKTEGAVHAFCNAYMWYYHKR
jgi:hypothetical protein